MTAPRKPSEPPRTTEGGTVNELWRFVGVRIIHERPRAFVPWPPIRPARFYRKRHRRMAGK